MIRQAVGSRLETSGRRMVFLSKVVVADGFGINMGAGDKDYSNCHPSYSLESGRGGGPLPFPTFPSF